MPDIKRRILVHPDNTATLERRMIIPAQNGSLPAERVLETKRTAAMALIPSHAVLTPLPPNCRFSRGEEGVHVYMIEEEPRVRTVLWNTQSEAYEKMRARLNQSGVCRLWGEDPAAFAKRLATQTYFSLAFPYILKFYRFVGDAFAGVSLWYRTRPVRTERDELLDANLPNRDWKTESYGLCCMADDLWKRLAEGEQTHVGLMQTFEREFWTSAWNDHWIDIFLKDAARMPAVASPWEWEWATKNDPLFVLKLPWRPTGRTVGSLVRQLLGQNDSESRRLFPLFAKRMLEADPFDRAPARQKTLHRVSPAETISVRGQDGNRLDLSVGDFIERPSGRYTVEWFGRPDMSGGRLVKLRECDEPEPLIQNGFLFEAVRVQSDMPSSTVIVGEVTITSGNRCRFSADEWPHRERRLYTITRVKRDGRGLVLVRLDEESHDTVIGEGTALYPGVAIMMPEPCDERGYITAKAVTFADGSTLREGERVLIEFDGVQEGVIEGFLPMNDEGAHELVFKENGEGFSCEDENGDLDPHIVRMPAEPITKVVIGDRTVRVGDFMPWRFGGYRQIDALSPQFGDGLWAAHVSGDWFPLGRGGLLTQKVFSPIVVTPAGVRVGDAFYPVGALFFDERDKKVKRAVSFGMIAEPDGASVRFDDDTMDVFTHNFTLVPWLTRVWRAKKTAEGRVVRRRMLLRLRQDVKEIRAGTTLRVSHIVVRENHEPHVFFEDGRGFPLTDAWLALFEKMVKGAWRPLVPGCARILSSVSYKPGEGLAPGVRARYLGGDPKTEFFRCNQDGVAIKTPLTLVRTKPDNQIYWLCRFDTMVPGGHEGYGEVSSGCGQWIHAEYLQRKGDSSVLEQGFTDSFKMEYVLPHVELVNPGKVVGTDKNDRAVKIGDRVRVHEIYHESPKRAHELAKQGVIFTVVHKITALDYALMDAGEDVGQIVWEHLAGFAHIPPHLQRDPAWWARLALAGLKNCERVD